MKSSSDELYFKDSSHDKISSKEDNLDKGHIKGNNIYKGLRDDDNRVVQLRVKKRIFRQTWKDKVGCYFQGIKGCSPSVIQKREKQCI